jgi:inositol-polyphosphate multikinase
MPTFLGALRPAADQAGLSKLLHGSDGVGSVPAGQEDSKEEIAGGKEQAPASAGDQAVPLAPGEEWTPSGGKKLSTGLAICLENTASGCTKPCVLDIKLGARLWDDDAPLAKRQKLDEVANSSTSGSLGFRVAGMKVYVGTSAGAQKLRPEEDGFVKEKDGYKTYDKFYGRQFKGEDDVTKAFEAYLPSTGSKYREEVGKRFIRELESVEYVLENTESRMYSASLLFVYEGDEHALGKALEYEKKLDEEGDDDEGEADGPKDENDEEIEPKVHDLKLIDFAHARWAKGEGRDENALRGVKSCLKIMRAVVG